MTDGIKWGPTGEMIYNRTYSRTKHDGSKETWPETVQRVVDGNLALDPRAYEPATREFIQEFMREREDLIEMITNFKILPAGRHLWASGVKGAEHLFNCWVSGWEGPIEDHFQFTFMRLMEGGGVGASYSNSYLADFGDILRFLEVHIVCDPGHADYEELEAAGVLSTDFSPEWDGAFIIEDSREGWAAALVDLIQTFYKNEVLHGQRVFDVSRVRPAGARLRTFGGTASGPLPLARMLQEVAQVFNVRYDGVPTFLDGISAMEIDHAIAQCVVAGGVRRSARMAMMHWADPQIDTFIDIKQLSGSHWTTNISVEVDNEFWDNLDDDEDTDLALQARRVMKRLSEGAVRNGEPGMWDSSLSNEGEPNKVVCTNPCGEITLQSWEPCNLSHVNLAAFVTEYGGVRIGEMLRAHRLATRFLIRATFSEVSDPKSREVLDRNRRIGIGHLGVASYLALNKIRFSDAPSDPSFRYLLRTMAEEVDRSAEELCHELRIPIPVKKRTIAPTGTVAKLSGVSEGIHPIFSRYFIRRVRLSKLDPAQVRMLDDYAAQGFLVEDDTYDQSGNTAVVSMATKDTLVQAVTDLYGADVAEEVVQSADELTLDELIAFQALYQMLWADNAVSFTANIHPDKYGPEDVEDTLIRFSGLIKGSTIFPEASMPQSPYERITKEEYDAALAKAVADGVDENCANGACPIK